MTKNSKYINLLVLVAATLIAYGITFRNLFIGLFGYLLLLISAIYHIVNEFTLHEGKTGFHIKDIIGRSSSTFPRKIIHSEQESRALRINTELFSDPSFTKEPLIESVDNSGIEIDALKLPISADLREVLDIINDYKGLITQKDLHNMSNYSEVKISIMLSELEKRGLIKKFKNGRENIVILIDKEV